MPMCLEAPPPLYRTDGHRAVACYLYREAPALPEGEINQVFRPRAAPTGGEGAPARETRIG